VAHVESVAMESTGVYWIPLFELLDSHGIEVILADTRQFSRASGRKTGAEDCQWIEQLHSCGLLQGGFRRQDIICHPRSLARQKAVFVAAQADWLGACKSPVQFRAGAKDVRYAEHTSPITAGDGAADGGAAMRKGPSATLAAGEEQ